MNQEDIARCLIVDYLKQENSHNSDIQKVIKNLTNIWALSDDIFAELQTSLMDLIPSAILNDDLFNKFINEGNTFLGSGKFDLSIKKFSDAIKINPNVSNVYSQRASAHMKKSNFSAAAKDLEIAVNLDSENAIAFSRLVFCYWSLGKNDLANKFYRIARINGIKDESLLNMKPLIGACASDDNVFDVIIQIQKKIDTPEFQKLLEDPDIENLVKNFQNDPTGFENDICTNPSFVKLHTELAKIV
ncbi:TPR Domain containing protein [Tritrichomonas foetus]|uniref:TPR Domain containing protein n=1 Tax=Tritrichomonas foetus TaxID=1144522 RepID=A0A1J4KP27_9EUKA|nr:TPR Domain containing protein [Tritrichomonas foetus]|eukprot:OHT12987.1 TPR Domain containing protein [Tritrichomonas foetus]